MSPVTIRSAACVVLLHPSGAFTAPPGWGLTETYPLLWFYPVGGNRSHIVAL